MKRPVPNVGQITRRAIGCVCIVLLFLSGYGTVALLAASSSSAKTKAGTPSAPDASVKPNRTLPKVEAPKGGLQFSAKPTVEEFLRARIFEEPLVPIGSQPTEKENTDLAAALTNYAKRSGPDDFTALTGFLDQHPKSAWRPALLTDLGLEYYNTGHYSLALEAWTQAWVLAKDVKEAKGKAIGDRAVGELASMYARVGRMENLEPLLKSLEGRALTGPATERISNAKGGLADMNERPEISFRCGPLALQRIKLSLNPKSNCAATILKSASTQKGFSLSQLAELSRKIDLNYQTGFREKGAPIVVPSVVHWKVGHYAAIIRQEGDRFLVQDPTFQNDVWITRQALEAEASGYFLIPKSGPVKGWRALDSKEGDAVWGKGNVGGPGGGGPGPTPAPCPPKGSGMAVSAVSLLYVSLGITDQPIGYKPPVGPPIDFGICYNQRDPSQASLFTYPNFGPKWTFDWLAYVTDNPLSPNADVQYYRIGGFARTFTGFDSASQSYAYQVFDKTRLTRTSASSYEMVSPDGSKKLFSQSDGSTGTSRKVFLTQIVDPFGNAVSLTYDSYFRIVAVTDAIGQVSTISYTNPNDIYKITKITDPFGRFATFDYDPQGRLTKITDVIGLTSQFAYDSGDFVNSLITPYGTTAFTKAENGTTRSLETLYPNGERDRVEFNQSTNLGIPVSVPAAQLPVGMNTHNDYLWYRNTYYWDRNAYAQGYPDYSKARIYHWLHSVDLASAVGTLESTKDALEGRVWRDYAGQPDPIVIGTSSNPTHIGRVLDDGTTQLYTYEYDGFGHVTKAIDPVGRTTSYIYAANGIDLLELRQTRAGNNELISKSTYNAQHLPLTKTDASGQATTYTYNSRGQVLTKTNPKSEVTTYNYDPNGYLLTLDGPLPGAGDSITLTYDAFGRVLTKTDENGYPQTFEYDALDRMTKITAPDSTFAQFTFTNLDLTKVRDRAGRETLFEYNQIRQMTRRTDPLNRVTTFDWCRCGALRSLTDSMGRTTTWRNDVEGRVTSKEYPDGSKISYLYETTTSRLRQRVDEKSQSTQYSYNRDNTPSSMSYPNAVVSTPPVTLSYDANYERLTSMSDGSGITRYSYGPITAGIALGAGLPLSVDGPLPNDTITYGYDELGRQVSVSINGIAANKTFDVGGRLTVESNALGVFAYGFNGSSFRQTSQTYPNGQTTEWAYGSNAQDQKLTRITNKAGAATLSEFLYGRDIPRNGRITSWSQQVGSQAPSVWSVGYDVGDEVTSAGVTNAGPPSSFGYSYDMAGNRLTESLDASGTTENYNALNQLTSVVGAGSAPVTNEWDAEQRLVAVNAGNERSEFSYDGIGQLVRIRKLLSGSEVSDRRFVWCNNQLREERTAAGAVTKRFFEQGVKIESGAAAGIYFYTRDHLNSIRELTDNGGNVRARYAYDPFGRRTRTQGDMEADFGFTGMFWASEAGLHITRYRAYDAGIGRWLSRDPLPEAEFQEGSNLYSYVHNNPVNFTDPLGLCCEDERTAEDKAEEHATKVIEEAEAIFGRLCPGGAKSNIYCQILARQTNETNESAKLEVTEAALKLLQCLAKPCGPCPQ